MGMIRPIQREWLLGKDPVEQAIKEIRVLGAQHHLCVRFSGGKDSIVLKRLMEMSGVSYEIRFSKTSVDPPELLAYIHKYHRDVIIDANRTTMFKLIIQKGFPATRICRFCCDEFKERNCCSRGAITVTGIRKEESRKRRNRNKYETCLAYRGVEFFHPIIDWTENQIWTFINDERLPYCELYDQGFDRIGCVGCPLTSSRKIKREFERWPQFEKAYLWAFERMLEGRSYDKWKTPADVMDWYIYGVHENYKKIEAEGQISLFDGDYYERFIDESHECRPDVEMAKALLAG